MCVEERHTGRHGNEDHEKGPLGVSIANGGGDGGEPLLRVAVPLILDDLVVVEGDADDEGADEGGCRGSNGLAKRTDGMCRATGSKKNNRTVGDGSVRPAHPRAVEGEHDASILVLVLGSHGDFGWRTITQRTSSNKSATEWDESESSEGEERRQGGQEMSANW